MNMQDVTDQAPDSPAPLAYAEPAPRLPWQMEFLVVATLVCAGTLLAGVVVHAWHQVTTPRGPAPAPAKTSVRKEEVPAPPMMAPLAPPLPSGVGYPPPTTRTPEPEPRR